MPLDELIIVPKNAELYAAYGAVMYGLHEAPEVGRYTGLDALRAYINDGRAARLGKNSGPPLARDDGELAALHRGVQASRASTKPSSSPARSCARWSVSTAAARRPKPC